MKVLAIIPPRYGSTRFPGKMLADKTGKFLIQHVYERVRQAGRISRVLVATDDERIRQAVVSFGGEAVMTSPAHPSGTDRVAEALGDIRCDLVVNVQGDEPEIEPATVDTLVELMTRSSDCAMGTLACPFSAIPDPDPADPNCVKVVVDREGRALYFSRSLLPYPRETNGQCRDLDRCYLHIGIYAYRPSFLNLLTTLPPTPLEKTERLEQLRVLEHGHRIAVGLIDHAVPGVDTSDDYEAFVQRVRRGR